jgi:c-di-GMP-binding flagellar brake protein YcgR
MDQAGTTERDKRNFTRLKTETAADVLIVGRDKRFRAICRDLSGGGMLMETRVGLKPGTELEVKLASRYGDIPMLKARTQVARVEKNAAGNFVLGLEILEILD